MSTAARFIGKLLDELVAALVLIGFLVLLYVIVLFSSQPKNSAIWKMPVIGINQGSW